ncbi:MAG: hypothetical protein ACRYGK_19160 [Janthinobacterium lividum]
MHWIDPLHLPETKGRVSSFLFNTHGDCDGFMLKGSLQVHVPPHLSKAILKNIGIGDTVNVRGIRPRGAEVVGAVSVTTAAGKTIEDHGPEAGPGAGKKAKKDDKDIEGKQAKTAEKQPKPPKQVEIHGTVARTIHGPRGEVSGALLESGEIVRLDHQGNEELLDYFQPGARIAVWGNRILVRKQVVIDLAEIDWDDEEVS